MSNSQKAIWPKLCSFCAVLIIKNVIKFASEHVSVPLALFFGEIFDVTCEEKDLIMHKANTNNVIKPSETSFGLEFVWFDVI